MNVCQHSAFTRGCDLDEAFACFSGMTRRISSPCPALLAFHRGLCTIRLLDLCVVLNQIRDQFSPRITAGMISISA